MTHDFATRFLLGLIVMWLVLLMHASTLSFIATLLCVVLCIYVPDYRERKDRAQNVSHRVDGA